MLIYIIEQTLLSLVESNKFYFSVFKDSLNQCQELGKCTAKISDLQGVMNGLMLTNLFLTMQQTFCSLNGNWWKTRILNFVNIPSRRSEKKEKQSSDTFTLLKRISSCFYRYVVVISVDYNNSDYISN